MSGPRIAVYGEFNYLRDADGLSTDQSFALFVARLGDFCRRLVIVGRLDAQPGRSHHKMPPETEFVALPDYPSLARGLQVLRATVVSVPTLWRSLDQVDAVWLLGPNPLGIVFALLAGLRRRRIVLGVRQDIVALTRSRHGRGLTYAGAVLLELAWRLLSKRCPVITVGAELERQYAGGRRVVPISVSLVESADVASLEEALGRDYSGGLQVLSVGRLEPQKNPLLLVEILAALRRCDDRWRLVVCGSGSLEDELMSRVQESGLAEHCDLRGYVPVEAGLSDLYRESHFFLHVSLTEGFPQVLVEAFGAGLPTVATAVGGVAGWAEEGALMVPPSDSPAAAQALQRLAGDQSLRATMVARELAIAAEHTVERECQAVVAVLSGQASPQGGG